MTPKFHSYSNDMFDYLDYLGYPEYIVEFEPEDIAKSIHGLACIFYEAGLSYRMAALSVFGFTWVFQIVPHANELRRQ